MPTLNWIGKKAVENHHREVPFHLLKDTPELSVGDSERQIAGRWKCPDKFRAFNPPGTRRVESNLRDSVQNRSRPSTPRGNSVQATAI